MTPTSAVAVMARITVDWGRRCFGQNHITDKKARALRLAEEAVELCQAVGVNFSQVDTLVRVVYSRPVGDPVQELGGVAMTSFVMAYAMGRDFESVAMGELLRCLSKSPEDFARRNAEKNALGLTG